MFTLISDAFLSELLTKNWFLEVPSKAIKRGVHLWPLFHLNNFELEQGQESTVIEELQQATNQAANAEESWKIAFLKASF